mmetsp:Transcript_1773/g.4439  ORF Transcript_1773/g.4439 Transcript_1773/m.4439 type:complete len:268 (-) Transcript_1773:657-1460(-)
MSRSYRFEIPTSYVLHPTSKLRLDSFRAIDERVSYGSNDPFLTNHVERSRRVDQRCWRRAEVKGEERVALPASLQLRLRWLSRSRVRRRKERLNFLRGRSTPVHCTGSFQDDVPQRVGVPSVVANCEEVCPVIDLGRRRRHIDQRICKSQCFRVFVKKGSFVCGISEAKTLRRAKQFHFEFRCQIWRLSICSRRRCRVNKLSSTRTFCVNAEQGGRQVEWKGPLVWNGPNLRAGELTRERPDEYLVLICRGPQEDMRDAVPVEGGKL